VTFALENYALFVTLGNIYLLSRIRIFIGIYCNRTDLSLGIEKLLSAIPFGFHLKFELALL
jgi:hypothetical protein